ncbi:MAG: FecR domain-containing protein [Pseudomonadales bacterium]|nr:FecR domain-containing protein [Pseudomonadales bacterium]
MKLIKPLLFLWLVLLYSPQTYANEWIYTFRPGDTLWDLCEKYIAARDCWKKIATRNQVQEPRQIKPGTRLYLPISWLKVLPASAKVLAKRGEAELWRAEADTSVPLAVSMDIVVGDKILTKDGTVTLQFADESVLIVTPGSEVEFDTLTMYGESGMVDTRVRLNRGRAKAKVKPTQGPASRYEILTPAAVAAVRGTAFRVVSESSDPPQMRTEVLEGNVAVGNESGEQALEAGYALKAVSGEAPAEPIKLLPPPLLQENLPEELVAFPWFLQWQAIDGASSYRIQLFKKGLLFDDLIKEARVSDSGFSISRLEQGRYDIVVRGIDPEGFEGLEAVYTVSVVSPVEMTPITVSANLVNNDENKAIMWVWPNVEGVEKYQLYLLADTSQGQQSKTIEVIGNQFSQGVTEPGEYRLKVAPILKGQVLSYSDEERFHVRDENEAPLWVKVIVGTLFFFAVF